MFDYNIANDLKIFADTILSGSSQSPRTRRIHESLLYITDGDLLIKLHGEEIIVRKGQIAYIGRGSDSDILSPYLCDKVTFISTNFNYISELNESAQSLPFNTMCSEGSQRYNALFYKAHNIFTLRLPAYLTNAKAVMLEIISNLYNEHVLSDDQLKKINEIKPGVEFIKQNFNNPKLKISEIANACNMSERNLRRYFSICYNKTPFEFLQEYRINQAEILLTSTKNHISEIAYCCGFSDVYSFSHCFKSHHFLSPSQYRNIYHA